MKPVYKLILPLLLLPILAACSSDPALVEPDAPAAPSIPDGPIELGLVISLGDDNSAAPRLPSRAPAGDYHPGSGAENFIDIAARDFALYIFTAGTSADSPGRPAGSDARLVSRAEITELTPLDGDYNSSKTYTCRFRLDNPAAIFGADGRASFRLVMLANWRAWTLPSGTWADYPILPEGASIDDLYAAAQSTRAYTPDSPVGPTITRDTRIPLFGVQAYTSVDLLANGLTDLTETLHLLRAFAKIEVYDGPETQKSIESVALTRSNTLFKALPSCIYDRRDYVTGSYVTDYVDHVSIPGDAYDSPSATPSLVINDIPFFRYPQGNSGKGSWIIYVPEFDNTSASAVPSRIRVTFAEDSPDAENYVEFKYYNGPNKDKVFDISRNNWYIYEVTRRNLDVKVTVVVMPYTSVALDPDYGLELEKDYIPVYDDNGYVMAYYDSKTGIYYGTDKVTVIFNPSWSVDPVNGWYLIHDDNGKLIYYYDASTGQYYDVNRNPIENPFA